MKLSKWDESLFKELEANNERNCNDVLVSNLKYLLPDNLSDHREMYTAIKFAKRQECLEKLKNPVQVSNVYKSPLQFNLS